MIITLSDGTTTLNLNPDLHWSDENSWSPVVQSVTYLLGGAPLIEVDAKQAGQPITLEEGEARALLNWTTLQQLTAWSNIPGKTLTLVFRDATYTVIFRHHEAPALSATPQIDYAVPQPDDLYAVTLKFMVI